MKTAYEIIVVGGGHAGCEAAVAAAKLGADTLLVTMDTTRFAYMSCNPAIGGIAKGQIVREIDALGGQTGIVTDKSTIQFRMLNKSKGPAMWSPRAQCDRRLFTEEWRLIIENTQGLSVWQDEVSALQIEDKVIKGVTTRLGINISAKAVILTNGTFLNGKIHIGAYNMQGGRMAEHESASLSNQLKRLGFKSSRLKTGTPARLDGKSIDFSKLIEQKGDRQPGRFSFLPRDNKLSEQRSCYIAHTNKDVHRVLESFFSQSPLFTGKIKGTGPRYCPSIEDKIVTFSDKDMHQLFLEPEGWNTDEYYINGFSSSLPVEAQISALRKIAGLENVHMNKPGYAIEYDYFNPQQLKHSLESKKIVNLFFAGQINGTTGYEEAAGQGLIAGINSFLKLRGKDAFTLSRDEAYIGVLLDDLVSKGVDEPYRMFTSRAEHRLLLRQDNADLRLSEKSYEAGLANETRVKRKKNKEQSIIAFSSFCSKTNVQTDEINPFLQEMSSALIKEPVRIEKIASRPEIEMNMLARVVYEMGAELSTYGDLSDEVLLHYEIELKYAGYLRRERAMADKLLKYNAVEIPEDMDFLANKSISTEGRQKLSKHRPKTIGEASRISGVSPSDLNGLLITIKPNVNKGAK